MRCRSTATACRCATGSTRATSPAAIGHVLEHGEAGEVYNAGGPDEEANIDVVRRIIALTARASHRSSTSATDPGTTGATRSPRRRSGRWAGQPRVRFDEGLERDRRVVSRERLVVGADPLGRATARTTSASTDARSADGRHSTRTGAIRAGRAPAAPCAGAPQRMLAIFHLPPSFTSETVTRALFPP